MNIHPNDPAMPSDYYVDANGVRDLQCGTHHFKGRGLSIRAELAARAMQGILAYGEATSRSGSTSKAPDDIAEYAVLCADALISELNKTAPATVTGEGV